MTRQHSLPSIGQVLLFVALAGYLVLPMVAVLLYSLATRWTAHVLPDGYTLDHWVSGLNDPRLVSAFFRSVGLAAAVAILDVALVVPAAYWARVRNPHIRTLTEVAAAIPFALPFVVIGFGILKLSGQVAPTLQGTFWIILLGHAAIAFPFLYWAVDGALSAASIERLSEAAETCGAAPLRIIWDVVLPNISAGIASGGILVFATSFGEFALVQILIGGRFETIPLWSLNLLTGTNARYNELAVITFVTFIVLFLVSASVVYWNRGQTLQLLPGRAGAQEHQGLMSSVTLRNVSKTFGSVRALDDVSLEVLPGELVALLGPSGCGKTTLLRSVAGLERPERGEILIGGANVTAVTTRLRPIGMVFQSYALFPNMTLRQNVGFPLRVRRHGAQQIRRRVDELLELVNLTDESERYPNQVSGGQQQRAALARALAPAPEVLLLDEPLSALDALVRTRLRDEIRRIQQAVKTTALYVTHDQAEAMAIADRVAVLNQGKIEQVARPPELYEAPATRFSAAFVGSRNAVELPVQDGWIALGDAFRVPAPPGSDGAALVFFRPEDVEILGNGRGEGLAAILEVKTFQGSLTRLHLVAEVDGRQARLQADLPSRQAIPLEPGSTIRIRVDPAGIRVFPATG